MTRLVPAVVGVGYLLEKWNGPGEPRSVRSVCGEGERSLLRPASAGELDLRRVLEPQPARDGPGRAAVSGAPGDTHDRAGDVLRAPGRNQEAPVG